MSIIITLVTFALLASCRTTDNKIVRVDRHKRFIEVHSSSDKKSAMLDPSKSDEFKVATSHTLQLAKESSMKKRSQLNLAKLYLMQKKYDAAEKASREVLRSDIKNKEAKKILAQVALRRNNPEMASILLNSIDATRSKDSQLLNLLGMVALKENKKALAIDYFRKALKLNPSDVAVRMNMGVLLIEHRQMREAAVQFERVLKLMPDHVDAKLHLAIIKSANGKSDEALAIYEAILDDNNTNPLALYNAAVIQRKNGDYEESLSNLKVLLKSKYARTVDNTDVFALIDRVQNEQSQATGDSASDQEIQSLAAKLKDGPVEDQSQVATVGPETKEAARIDSEEATSSDDILELEKELLGQ